MLLELNEKLLNKYQFNDVWKIEKEIENLKALELLENRINELDQISDSMDRWHEIFRGILAGNIFDYGATQVQELLKSNKNFDLHEALSKIQKRPWLIDNFGAFIERLEKVCMISNYVTIIGFSSISISETLFELFSYICRQ